jgi:hypothetical protein
VGAASAAEVREIRGILAGTAAGSRLCYFGKIYLGVGSMMHLRLLTSRDKYKGGGIQGAREYQGVGQDAETADPRQKTT